MLRWVQSGLSSVGLAEPEYGREAIHPITDMIKGNNISRETTKEDFAWKKPWSTNVETQTFYYTCLESGFSGFAQVIHSNVMGVHTTAQFTFKMYNFKDKTKKEIWTSTKLEDFRCEGTNFYAKNLSIELSGDNTEYILKSAVNTDSVVELKMKREVPGLIFGQDGTSYYGDDIKNPWGSMRHAFWPRCSVEGTIKTSEHVIEIKGLTMFVMALQGMKPHHAAKSWNFLNFQSENYSAVQMEFTTPKSYANTKVNVAILTSKLKILLTSINNTIEHQDPEIDDVGWPVPKSITFNHKSDGKNVAKISGKLDFLESRIDVMAEIPMFVKNIVNGVSGAKPYIYQFCNPLKLELEGGDSEVGIGFNEATFISE